MTGTLELQVLDLSMLSTWLKGITLVGPGRPLSTAEPLQDTYELSPLQQQP
jgi:hypothetical protein